MHESVFRHIWHTQCRTQVCLIGLSAIVFPLSLTPLELQRRIIDDAIASSDADLLVLLCGLFFAAMALQGGLKYLLNTWRGRAAETMIRRLRLRIREILAGDSAPDPGRAVAMATAEVERLGGFAGDAFATPLLQVGVLLSVFGYMLFVEPWLAIVGIVLFVPQMLLVPTMQNMINRRAAVRTRIVRGFGQSVTGDAKEDNGWPERAIDKIFAIRMAIYRLKAAMKATLNLLNHSSEIGVLLAGGMLVIQGETQIGTVVAFISGLQRLRRPWHDLITYYRQASDAGVKYRLLRSVLDA